MRIFITTMDEPLYTNPFIKKIIDAHHDNIVGVAVSKGNPLTTRNPKQYIASIIAMLIIMGIPYYIKHFLLTILFYVLKIAGKCLMFVRSPSIITYAGQFNIPCYNVKSVNSPQFLDIMQKKKPDVVINQAQEILKDEFLSIPTIGCLNRHNSLLPRHRGRFSPFWVLYNEERETGVTIHFVSPRLDAGEIVVQKKVAVNVRDTFLTLTQKCYEMAGAAMIEALRILDAGYIRGSHVQNTQKGNYNPLPSVMHALRYHGLLQKKRREHNV